MKLFAYKVELWLGPLLGWVDITADVRGDVSIKRGRQSQGGRAEPGSCSLRLDNLARKYSPRDPAGSWYGLLGRNTPLRVSAGRLAGPLVGRFYGEVSEWPPGWNLTGSVRYVDVEAAGVLRRLGQGEPPKWSPLRRTIAGSGPVAYWPLEDGSDAGQGGSAVAGVPALTVTGTAPFDDIESWTDRAFTVAYGTAALVDVAQGATLAAEQLPADVTAATATGWTVHAACDFPDSGALLTDFVLLEVDTPGGTYVRWRVVLLQSAYDVQVLAYDAAGAATVVCTDTSPFIGMFTHHLVVWQNGANISVGYVWDSTSGWQASGSVAGTLAGVTAIRINPTAVVPAANPVPVGHLALWPGQALATVDFDDGPVIRALFAHVWTNLDNGAAAVTGEGATARLERLAGEDGLPVDLPAVDPADDVLMGVQPTDTLAALLDQCIDADGGYLYEQRGALGLAYRPRVDLYNQAPTPIGYTGQLAPPFRPVDDADDVRNDVTVKRVDGSSARAVKTTGRLAATPPPDGVGVYRTSPELNLVDDTGLSDQAQWRVHLGTVDRPRYPSLTVQLASPEWQAAPAALDALLAADVGDVLEVTGLPVWAAGDVRTLLLGYTETITEYTWQITYAGVPAQPWDVAQADG
ncbi:MAG TPA: hypothetical protein VIQ30_03385, partial [Pseudonocardia sp.]